MDSGDSIFDDKGFMLIRPKTDNDVENIIATVEKELKDLSEASRGILSFKFDVRIVKYNEDEVNELEGPDAVQITVSSAEPVVVKNVFSLVISSIVNTNYYDGLELELEG